MPFCASSEGSGESAHLHTLRPKKKIVVFQMTLRKKSGSVGREKLFFFFFFFFEIRPFMRQSFVASFRKKDCRHIILTIVLSSCESQQKLLWNIKL